MAEETVVTLEDVMAAAETLSKEDRERLNSWLVSGLRAENDQKQRQLAASFKVGDRVSFLGRKRGLPITGKIVGFGGKNVKVDSYQDKYGYPTKFVTHWTVSPSLLTLVKDKPNQTPQQAAVNRMTSEVQTLTSKDIGVITIGSDGKLEIK